jgi:tetratricopeptide (TPR) repeat protein
MSGREWACAADAAAGLRHARRTGRAGTYLTRLIRSLSHPYIFGDGTAAQMETAFSDLLADLGSDPRISEPLLADRELLRAFDRDVEEATALALDQYAWLVDKGSLWMAASALTWRVAWCQRWSGDLAAAAASMQTAAALYGRLGETGARSSTLAELSLRLARLGRDDEARAALDESRAITSRGDLLNDMHYSGTEGVLCAHLGDADGARRHFVDSLRIASGTDFAVDHGDLWLARSEAQAALGDRAGAVESAQEALAIFRRKGQAPPIRVTEAQLAAVDA